MIEDYVQQTWSLCINVSGRLLIAFVLAGGGP